jgi:bifunctional DNA-binding transcriptional regulator/antitoxin component of YhaV-PrlF toxin-antitoxin module
VPVVRLSSKNQIVLPKEAREAMHVKGKDELLCDPVFQAIENNEIKATTSTLKFLEILVQPYRKKLDDLVLKFFALLTTYPNLQWVDLNLDIADTAARLRAEHRLKTPDAIQEATAICSMATGLLRNQAAFKRVKGFDTLLLDDCL